MATEILMPALSPTMEEGTLAKWLVKEGDEVKSGDILAEIETDKATMEFEAVDEGTVGKILIEAGTEGVKVNTPIAVLVEDGESADDIDTGSKASEADAPSSSGDALDDTDTAKPMSTQPGASVPEPEPVGGWDLAALVWELAVVGACLAMLRTGSTARKTPRLAAFADWQPSARAVAAASPVALAVLTLVGANG